MLKQQIPNALTLSRVFFIPVLLWLYYADPSSYWPLVAFMLIAFTDYLDGYLARLWRVESAFGAYLDPAADKMLVCALLISLSVEHQTWLFQLPALLIIAREVFMTILREWLSRMDRASEIAVDNLGKYKTTTQMLALTLFLVPHSTALLPAYLMLYFCVILTYISLLNYISKFAKLGLSSTKQPALPECEK